MKDARPIVEILSPKRQIKTVLMTKSVDIDRRRAIAEHLEDRVARDKMNEQKNQRHHQPHDRQSKNEAGQDLLHRSFSR